MPKKKKGSSKSKPGGSHMGPKKLGGAGHEMGGYVGSHTEAKRFKGEHKTARARGKMSNKRAADPAMRQPSLKHLRQFRKLSV